jgi:hypothetical protein
MFEYRAMRGIFEPTWDEITGVWRKLHNEELNDLYCSIITVRVIKSRKMRGARHVERMETGRGTLGLCAARESIPHLMNSWMLIF